MDRNYLTGLMLIFLLLAIYFQYSAPETPASKKTDDPAKEVFEKQEAVLKATGEAPLEMDSATRQKNYGAFAALAQGKAQSFKIENEVMEAHFNTRGGRIEKVVLKKYRTHDQKPLVLLAPRQSGMQMEVKAQKGGWIDLYTLYYTTPAQPKVLKKGETTEIRFTATLKPGQTIEHIYKLSGQSYAIDYQVKLKGLEKLVSSQAPARFYWIDQMQKLESDMYYARYYATINYSTAQEEYNYLNWPSEAEEKINFEQEKLHWFSFKHRFFNASIIAPHRNLQNVRLICSTPSQDPQVVKVAQAYADIPALDLKNGKAQFQFFFGPNHYPTLRSLKVSNFDKNVHLGWAIFGWVSKFVIIPLFIALEGSSAIMAC
ncbi:MAG: membrane protein insertase YidC [Microscillaceae bacterium]|nr:membrane protein insertase YidC [Microscillaceae bacterium]